MDNGKDATMVDSVLGRQFYAVGFPCRVSTAYGQNICILELGLPRPFPTKDYFRPSAGCVIVSLGHSAKVFFGRVTKFSDSVRVNHVFAMGHVFEILKAWIFTVAIYVVNLLAIGPCSYERSRHQDMNANRFSFIPEAQNYCRISTAVDPRFEYSSRRPSPPISGRVVPSASNSTDIRDFVKSLISRNIHRTPFFCWDHIRLLSETLLFNGRQRGKEIPAFAARRLGDQETILT